MNVEKVAGRAERFVRNTRDPSLRPNLRPSRPVRPPPTPLDGRGGPRAGHAAKPGA